MKEFLLKASNTFVDVKSAYWLPGIIALHFLGYDALVTETINKSCPRDAHGSVGKVSDQSPIHIYYLLSSVIPLSLLTLLFLFLLLWKPNCNKT